MARTQHLPLYQSVFIYTREVYRLRAGFQKSIKHDLGEDKDFKPPSPRPKGGPDGLE